MKKKTPCMSVGGFLLENMFVPPGQVPGRPTSPRTCSWVDDFLGGQLPPGQVPKSTSSMARKLSGGKLSASRGTMVICPLLSEDETIIRCGTIIRSDLMIETWMIVSYPRKYGKYGCHDDELFSDILLL